MSQAEELLNALAVDEASTYTIDADSEPHIVVNSDRTITVPDELKHIAVQFDHNAETVTFDCPRYWDEHDFSAMHVYINYQRPDNYKDQYLADNVRIDETDDTIIHFEWTISKNVTQQQGNITFLVCIKSINEDGEEEPHWNSRRNSDLIIDPGLECSSQVVDSNPDIIEDILTDLENLETNGSVMAHPITDGVSLLDLEEVGFSSVPVDGSVITRTADCTELREVLVDEVIKVRVLLDVSGVIKCINAFSIAQYYEDTDTYQLTISNTTHTDDVATTYVINIDVGVDTISVSAIQTA